MRRSFYVALISMNTDYKSIGTFDRSFSVTCNVGVYVQVITTNLGSLRALDISVKSENVTEQLALYLSHLLQLTFMSCHVKWRGCSMPCICL